MSETATKLLEDRIQAIVGRVKELAAERDMLRDELDVMRARMEHAEADVRENARLRAALEDAIRELRED